MAKFAVIHNNSVSNIIVSETRDMAEQLTGTLCVEYQEGDHVTIGMLFEPETETLAEPVK